MGIIGVVAAITMPSVIANYKKHVAVTRAKQTYTILNNAIERAKADYGIDVSEWEWVKGSNKEKSMNFAEKYMLPYLKTFAYSGDKAMREIINMEGYNQTAATASAGTGVNFVLNNGVLIYLAVGYMNESEAANAESGNNYDRVNIVFDIDGTKGYNQIGKDIFRVELGGRAGWVKYDMSARNRFLPYYYDSSLDCEFYLTSMSGSNHACNNEGSKNFCLAYIMCKGWKIDDKYPW